MDTKKIIEKPVAPCCVNCVYFNITFPQADQPFTEIWCGKNLWDSVEYGAELYEPNNCVEFLKKKIYVRY